jgi:hypothetical protein
LVVLFLDLVIARFLLGKEFKDPRTIREAARRNQAAALPVKPS